MAPWDVPGAPFRGNEASRPRNLPYAEAASARMGELRMR